MKIKALYLCFLGLFLVICLTLSVGILLYGPALPGANEQLQKAPVWTDDEGNQNDNYLGDAAAWVNDHFYLRQTLVSSNHLLNKILFGTSGEDTVIVGKDGWLYFAETLDNYTGLDAFSDRELYAITQNLAMMAQYCQDNGTDFTFLIAPNKNTLYPQYMPDFGATAATPDSRKVLDMLASMDVSTVDLFTQFQTQPEILYYATDSHWHTKGAALAADLINETFGVKTAYYNGPFGIGEMPYTGDLYHMLFPAFEGTEEDPVYKDELNFTYTGKSTKPDAITLTTESAQPGSILVYRDSFGNLLHPYLAASYGSAQFSRSNTYDLTQDYDHVLIELVERNLSYLLKNVPVMESPAEELTLPQTSGSVTIVSKPKSNAPEGYVLWTGTAAADIDPDSPVYIQANSKLYRAFLTENNGFAVYLPAHCAPEGVAWYVSSVLTFYSPK